ncbi:MAG: dUTP diphosphatase [Acutalibacteraceae bacterium]|nr:dUTP diphosphatase [Acutalibacteraceae bacterium]
MELKIKKLNNNAIVPCKATEGSAGMDLYACIDTPITIKPFERALIPTGIAAALPSNDYAIFLFARSGLGIKYGIALANGVGVVDSDYRGEICVGLQNSSNTSYTINPNDRIAQMVVMPVCSPEIIVVNQLDETERNAGGFGSTGK